MIDLSVHCAWFTLGIMVFFGVGIAPVVFTTLEPAEAGSFLRKVFPRLYLVCGGVTGIAGILATLGKNPPFALAFIVTSLLFFVARGPLTTAINDARDAQLEGDVEAGHRFDRLHKLSTRIFGVQALTLIGIAIYHGVNG